ncbi:MAG: 50S ribosomal protein L23 [Saprospiraceae bacterium]|jgi:large subunit ribosomal protein L23|nr:50S ribosomal protein L23 [Saprospiraceae bacterium]MBL0295496.1 50S ribosomal protein L23 [Saprospiraceae bacterium]
MSEFKLKKPIISEKAQVLAEKSNTYSFVVEKSANKIEIKNAVQALYGVTVTEVNTAIMPGKVRTRYSKSGVMRGMKPSVKKAYVKLVDGDQIDLFATNNNEE